MKWMFFGRRGSLCGAAFCLFLAATDSTSAQAKAPMQAAGVDDKQMSPYRAFAELKVTQSAGVDNTKMGPYRALAELCFEAFQRGDNRTAAQLARILERSWDRAEAYDPGEGRGDSHAIGKIDRTWFRRVDGAMDAFIQPIINYASKPPSPVALKTAYMNYLEKLNAADCTTHEDSCLP